MKRALFNVFCLVMSILMLFASGCAEKPKYGTRNLNAEYFEKNAYDVLSRSVDLKEIFGNENPFNVLFTENERLNMKFDVDLEQYIGKYGKLSFETNMDSDNKRGSVYINIKGLLSQNIDFMVYADSRKILLSSDAFFGEGNVYSVEFKALGEMISEFAQSSLAEYLGFEENEIYDFCEKYGINDEYLKTVVLAAKEYDEAMDNIYRDAEGILRESFEKCMGDIAESTAEVNGYEVDALVMDVVIDDNFIRDTAQMYADSYEAYVENQYDFIEKVIPEKLRSDLGIDYESIKDEMIRNIKSNLDPIMQQSSDAVTLKLYLDKKEGKLRKVTCDKDGYTIAAYLTDEIRLEYSEDGETVSFLRIYSTENADTKAYCFEIANPDDGEKTEGIFEIVRFENRYNIYIRSMNGEEIGKILFESAGRFMYSENSLEVSPEYIMSDDIMFYPGITVGISGETYIMEHENHKSIFSLSENEICGITNRFAELFTGVLTASKPHSYKTGSYIAGGYGY